MAKIVYACVRDINNAPLIKRRIESVIEKLVPDNIPDARCKVVDNGQIIYGISTYNEKIEEMDDSVCMGVHYNGDGNWWKPGADHPEGSYAIFRADDEHVEAVADMGCTRAVWYYKDDDIFVAGTSQRAVINVVGKFEMERRNITWMLSSGAMAPSLSWCKNLRFVNPDGAVLLNRKTWTLTVKSERPEFPIRTIPDKEFYAEFKKLLIDSFRDIRVDLSDWILPISGGYDSRGIACLLKESGNDISRLHTITWGTQASEKIKTSDGFLGGAVAKSLGMPHRFWATDAIKEDTEKIFERFILCSEGRVDHIGAYSDGMAIWKSVFESGKHGIIRGDETFGGPESNSFVRSRHLTGFKFCSDFSNLENYEQYGFEKQVMNEYLREIPGQDTPGLYRDRIYQENRMPFTLSALSDIKFAYTEILNPFLTKEIILRSRTLPDHLRSNKILCAKIIDDLSPRIPYATEEATDEDILKSPSGVRILLDEICSNYMKDLFPEEFLNNIILKLQKPPAPINHGVVGKLKMVMKRHLPVALKERVRTNMPKPALDINRLALRIYITGKVYKMFTEDVVAKRESEKVLCGNSK